MTSSSPLIIAIDGPSASGKGTIARKLAAQLGFAYLDTGLLYRAVGFGVVSAGGNPEDAEMAEEAALALAMQVSGGADLEVRPPAPVPRPRGAGESPVLSFGDMQESRIGLIDFHKLMADEVLRTDEAGVAASKVAAIPEVRAALLKCQQDFCAMPPGGAKGAVLDGRDIGTVIAPDAAVKIFVTASAEARAERRFKELQRRGVGATYEAVLADMKARDARDAERAIAPTKPAADAVLLDTTTMNAEQALAETVKIVESKIG
ncbi:MAG: d(CMP) kinase [Alphaproteobacteria bacterium]|nr:d(CMP) kinase [Alphaproteobacteria bacterium]